MAHIFRALMPCRSGFWTFSLITIDTVGEVISNFIMMEQAMKFGLFYLFSDLGNIPQEQASIQCGCLSTTSKSMACWLTP